MKFHPLIAITLLAMPLTATQTIQEIDVAAHVPQILSMNVNGVQNASTVDLPIMLSTDSRKAKTQNLTGIIEVPDAILVDSLMSNWPLVLSVRLQQWIGSPTVKPTLQFRVRNVSKQAGSMAAIASNWTSLNANGVALLSAGRVTAEGYMHGLRGGAAVIDLRAVFPPGKAPAAGWMASLALIHEPQSP